MEGFIPHKIGSTEQTAFEYIDAAAATYQIGEALAFNAAGLLALCGATVKPQYIAMKNVTLAENGRLCVTPVRPDIVYETHNQAAFTSVKKGSRVTLHTDGMRVTATTAGGVATVLDFEGTAAGRVVHVCFEDVNPSA